MNNTNARRTGVRRAIVVGAVAGLILVAGGTPAIAQGELDDLLEDAGGGQEERGDEEAGEAASTSGNDSPSGSGESAGRADGAASSGSNGAGGSSAADGTASAAGSSRSSTTSGPEGSAGSPSTGAPAQVPPGAAGSPPPTADAEVARRPPTRRVVEEVIVTAQKTEQSLREVPISMSVLDDEFIERQNISDYRDLALYTPNAHVDPGNGLFPDINVRGFGSALSNKAFEQSVGLVIDGVPYGRTAYFQGPLFDVDRVELLRGPQGTLFGKNTTAGLLNVVTKKPTDELTGAMSVEIGELNRRRYDGAIGGPVIPGFLNFRLSGLLEERDGFVKNTTARIVPTANERMNGRDRTGLRAQLGFPDLFGASLVVAYEHIDFDFTGIGWELHEIPERTRPFYEFHDPDVDFIPDNYVGSLDTEEFNHNQLDTVTANASYDVFGWGLDAVAGYSFLRVRSLIDDDFGPAKMTFNTSIDDDPQTTFELRTTSPNLPGLLGLESLFGFGLGSTNLTAGFFFQQRDIDDSQLGISFNGPVLAQFLAFNSQPEGSPVPPLADFVGDAIPIGDLGVFDTNAPLTTTMFYEQESQAIAGFAQMDWHWDDRWTLQYGMRLTEESKEASWSRRATPAGAGALFIALGGQDFEEQKSRSELAFTPKVSLKYDWTDDVNFYASWAKGFKAGGFNEQAFNPTDEALTYRSEKATAWEAGTKSKLLDGAATLNVGLFLQNVTDFQVLTLPPNSVATTVVNAGEARARGVEIDGNWLPTDWLTLFGAMAFNDSEFLEFPFGQCSFDRPDTDGNGDGRCDHKGQPMFRTPKWQGSLVANAAYPLTGLGLPGDLALLSLNGVDVLLGGTMEYQDVQYLERTYDERVRQAPFFRFGLNFGFADQAAGWRARLSVENLTDETTGVVIRDVPLGGGNFAKIPEPPRQIFGSVQWSF